MESSTQGPEPCEGALHPNGGERDPELLEDLVPGQAARLFKREPRDLLGEHRSAGDADRATVALEANLGDPLGRRVDLEPKRDVVAAEGIRFLSDAVGVRKGSEVLRSPVVLEDDLLVHVEHGGGVLLVLPPETY